MPDSERIVAMEGESVMLNEDRLLLEYGPAPGPVDLLRPVAPAVDECAYRLDEGSGRNVGVVGLDAGVGMELAVVVVLTLLRPSVDVDKRDGGR